MIFFSEKQTLFGLWSTLGHFKVKIKKNKIKYLFTKETNQIVFS